MSRSLEVRLERLEQRRKPERFEPEIGRARFDLALDIILCARSGRHIAAVSPDFERVITEQGHPEAMGRCWRFTPWEPQPPADWSSQERAYFHALLARVDELETSHAQP
ncbi:MAG: hypothetical protein HKL99_16815 [Burkholderiales bacterium]|nr:hypothetical protein [Burkholderiales bacterium]